MQSDCRVLTVGITRLLQLRISASKFQSFSGTLDAGVRTRDIFFISDFHIWSDGPLWSSFWTIQARWRWQYPGLGLAVAGSSLGSPVQFAYEPVQPWRKRRLIITCVQKMTCYKAHETSYLQQMERTIRSPLQVVLSKWASFFIITLFCHVFLINTCPHFFLHFSLLSSDIQLQSYTVEAYTSW